MARKLWSQISPLYQAPSVTVQTRCERIGDAGGSEWMAALSFGRLAEVRSRKIDVRRH